MINIETKVAGFFKIEAHKVNEAGEIISSRVCADWFSNTITNQGLNYMGTETGYLGCCQVGTGNAAPAATDTQLQTYLAGTSTITPSSTAGVSGSSPYYGFCRATHRFAVGVATGNISEVGIGDTTTAGNLYSRALVVDGVGSPTTITVLADEVLDVTYEHRTYAPLTDVTGIITISGVNYNYIIRASNVTTSNAIGGGNSGWGMPAGDISAALHGIAGTMSGTTVAYNGTIGAITTTPSGTTDTTLETPTQVAYSNNSYNRSATLNAGLTNGNLAGGIRCVSFGFGWCYYQCEFTPILPKDSTKILALTFNHAWARATI